MIQDIRWQIKKMTMTISKIVTTVFALLLVLSFTLWGVQGMANYSASFIAFLLVATASFVGYKKVISASNEAYMADEEEDEEAKPSKFTLLTRTYKGWLFPFRLLAYTLFVFVFLYFANNNMLSIFAFLTGIAVVPISALIFILFFRRNFD